MKKILTAGIYFLDTIVVRDYPEGPQKQRTFNENVVLEEVGGTCGNVATILSWLGQDVYPIAHFDESAEGHKLSADLAHYGCKCRFVRNDADGFLLFLNHVSIHQFSLQQRHDSRYVEILDFYGFERKIQNIRIIL